MWKIDLYDALATLLIGAAWPDDSLPPIAHLDLYYGQYDDPENFHPFKAPAVFLDMTEEAANAGWGSAQVLGSVDLHLVIKSLENTARNNQRRPEEYRKILTLPNYLMARVQHHEGERYGKLTWIRTEPIRKIDSHYATVLRFSTGIRDNAANYLGTQTAAPAAFPITKQIIDEL